MQKHWQMGQRLIGFLIFLAALLLTHRVWLPVFGHVLLVPDRLQKADCIVVLRGDEYFRLGKAAELYKAGVAPGILTSVIPKEGQPYDMIRLITGYDKIDEKEMTLKIFEYFGVKPSAIEFTGRETTSTFQEAEAARDYFKEHGFKSMLLVTSTYHMERSLFLFRRVFKGSGVTIYNVTAQNTLYDPVHWWRHERDVRRVGEEYFSFAYNWVNYFFLKKHGSPSFDSA